jgi:hypothetical protein
VMVGSAQSVEHKFVADICKHRTIIKRARFQYSALHRRFVGSFCKMLLAKYRVSQVYR